MVAGAEFRQAGVDLAADVIAGKILKQVQHGGDPHFAQLAGAGLAHSLQEFHRRAGILAEFCLFFLHKSHFRHPADFVNNTLEITN